MTARYRDEGGTPTGGAKRRREERSRNAGPAALRPEVRSAAGRSNHQTCCRARVATDATPPRARILTEREGERGVREPLRLPELERQLDAKGRPLARHRVDEDVPAQHLGQPPRQGEPEPGAA